MTDTNEEKEFLIKKEVNTMDNIDVFRQLFQYGYHNTEITSIEGEDSEVTEIRLNFDKGIYLLDENGKETVLSEPMQVILKLEDDYESLDNALAITEYGKKIKFLEYRTLKKYLRKSSFVINMCYYSDFNECVLFDGKIAKRTIMLETVNFNEIVFQKL